MVVTWIVTVAARGQTDESLLLDSWDEGQQVESTSDFFREAVAGTSARPDRTGLTEVDSTGRVRLTTDLDIAPSLGYDWMELRFDHELHDRVLIVPRQFDDLSLGAGTPLMGDKDGFLAMTAAIGYAGSNAFGDSNAWYGRGSVIFGKELDPNHSLAIWLDYDGNRTLFPDIPLPGFAYAVTVDDTLSFVLGLPNAAVTYQPLPEVELHAEWQAVDTIDAKFTWHIVKPVDFFMAFDNDTSPFHSDDLPDARRFFFSEDRAEMGVLWKPMPWLSLSLAGGYSFGRTIDRGYDERNLDRVVKLSDTPFVHVSVTVNF